MMKKERIATLDVARGFTVLIMPAVHSVMLYSALPVQQGALGKVLGFLAEGPGAQLFLLLMGLSITLAKRKTPVQVLNRACLLFALAYVLNFVRLVIPATLYTMPREFMESIAAGDAASGGLHELLMGDILQTAAISYLVCGLLYAKPRFTIWAILLITAVTDLTPWLRQATGGNTGWQYANLFTGEPPAVFFPLVPWIVYPLAGLVMGKYLKSVQPKNFYRGLLITGILLIGAGKMIMVMEPAEWNANFYCPGPGGAIYHLGIVCVWLYGCNIGVSFFGNNLFFDLLRWLSRHITLVYFVQWIVVLWLLPIYQYHQSDVIHSAVAILINSTLAFGITYLIIRIKSRLQRMPAQTGRMYPETI